MNKSPGRQLGKSKIALVLLAQKLYKDKLITKSQLQEIINLFPKNALPKLP